MSYIKKKLVWVKGDSSIELNTGITRATCRKTKEPVNNRADITLTNFDVLYSSGTFLPVEGDLMFYYSKEVTSNDEKDFTDDDIVWTGKFIDRTRNLSPDSDTIVLKIGDWSYDVNNRYHNKSYVGLGFTTDEVLIDIIQNKVENDNGDGTFKLDFTNVSSTRNDGSSFPVIEPAFAGKPTHEWIDEISSIQNTNTDTELNSTLVVEDDMIFDIRGTSVYWYEAGDTPVLEITEETVIHDIKDTTKNEETSNFLILDLGEDFNGEAIFWYAVDKNATSKLQKDEKAKVQSLAGLSNDYDDAYHTLRKNYTLATNSDFVTEVKKKAEIYAQQVFKRNKSREITVTLERTYINIGDVVKVNIPKFANELYTVKTITHNDGENEQTTQLTLEIKV